jgi:BirA family biotin operon repressor/biotin-[acetyl-CoA-carboxylase] ligase
MAGDLSESTLQAALGPRPFKFLKQTGSTNIDALEWAIVGAPEGSVVVAEQQTEGRGRWGRRWLSQPGRSLMFSIVLRPPIKLVQAGLITTALGVGCAEAIARLTNLPVRLKWPNDLMVEVRKLGGLLVESRVTDEGIEFAAGGVGLNVTYAANDFPVEIRGRATSLAIELDSKPPARPDLLAAMLTSFSELYPEMNETSLLTRASGLSDVLGRRVRIRFADGRATEGRALRLVANGALEVETDSGVRVIESGEVESFRDG